MQNIAKTKVRYFTNSKRMFYRTPSKPLFTPQHYMPLTAVFESARSAWFSQGWSQFLILEFEGDPLIRTKAVWHFSILECHVLPLASPLEGHPPDFFFVTGTEQTCQYNNFLLYC